MRARTAPPRNRSVESKPKLVPRLAALAVVALVVGCLYGATGSASAFGGPPSTNCGFATPDGSFVVPYYQGLLSATNICPGDTVFADVIWLQFITGGANRSVQLTTVQPGTPTLYYNNTYSVTTGESQIQFTLPSTLSQRTVLLCFDGGCFSFVHLTPLTIFPSGFATVGGIDLIVLAIVVEFAVLIPPTLLFARWLTKKANGYSPPFHAALIIPHVVLGFLILFFVDYQAVDQAFGGIEFVFFPVVFDLMLLGWALDKFNDAGGALVERPEPRGGHKLDTNLWIIVVGELPDGTKILIGRRWRDWWARLFGHYPILSTSKNTVGLRGYPAEWGVTLRRAGFRPRPTRRSPLDGIEIAGDVLGGRLKGFHGVKLKWKYWVDSDGWLVTEYPRLSFHRTVDVPPKVSSEGAVLVPATTKRKWSWPHYVDVPASEIGLAGFHYYDTVVQALGWVKSEKWNRRIENLRLQLAALRSDQYGQADEWAQEQVAEMARFLDRARRPLTEAEEEEETHVEGTRPRASAPEGPPTDDRPPTLSDRRARLDR